MPFGNIFSRFEYVNLETADGVQTKFKNNFLTEAGFNFLGMPHIGLRLRARNIMGYTRGYKSVLDAGFGSGIYSFSVASRLEKVEAVDIAEKKVAHAKKINIFKNINFQQGDLCKLRFKDNSFDLIICSDVLEHIKNDEKAFSELARVLKINGTLLLTVPSDSEKNRDNYKSYKHERAGYSVKDIFELCRKNHLATMKVKGYSCSLAEVFSKINYKISGSKLLLGIMFYPLYFAAIVSDLIFRSYNGYFFQIKKK